MPKGGRDGERRPIAHRLHARVLELEAKLETYVQDVTQVPGVLALLDLLKQPEPARPALVYCNWWDRRCWLWWRSTSATN